MLTDHIPTYNERVRVRDLARVGVSQEIIASIMGFSVETLVKHYHKEIYHSTPEIIERIGNKAFQLANEGNEKMISLVLKTKGAQFGWVEKQVIETVENKETEELKSKIAELEQKYNKEY